MIVIEMNLKWINCIWGIVIEVSLLCSLCLGVDTLIISSNFYLSRGVTWCQYYQRITEITHFHTNMNFFLSRLKKSSKKSSTERLHDNWHFCYVVVSDSSLQTKSEYISIWTKILIKCSVCCTRFIWVICLRLDSITQKYDTVYCL